MKFLIKIGLWMFLFRFESEKSEGQERISKIHQRFILGIKNNNCVGRMRGESTEIYAFILYPHTHTPRSPYMVSIINRINIIYICIEALWDKGCRVILDLFSFILLNGFKNLMRKVRSRKHVYFQKVDSIEFSDPMFSLKTDYIERIQNG